VFSNTIKLWLNIAFICIAIVTEHMAGFRLIQLTAKTETETSFILMTAAVVMSFWIILFIFWGFTVQI